MPVQISPDLKSLLDLVGQLLVIVVPVLLSWFVRTYVRSSTTEKKLTAVVRVANAAIDYAEYRDKRGEITLPPEVSKGMHKLGLAADWMETELKQSGISMTDDEARRWIASEFQKRMGGVQPVTTIATAAKAAVDTLQTLQQSGSLELPPLVDRISYLTEQGADLLLTDLAKQGVTIQQSEAATWVRAEVVKRLASIRSAAAVPDDRLKKLADAAVDFVNQLKAAGRLVVRPGASHENVDSDIAVAWLLTEAAKQGLNVSTQQIAEAIDAALRQAVAPSAAAG